MKKAVSIVGLTVIFLAAVIGVAWFAVSEQNAKNTETDELEWSEVIETLADDGGDVDVEAPEGDENPKPQAEEQKAPDSASTEQPAEQSAMVETSEHQAKTREPIGAETQTKTCPHCGSTGHVGDPYCQYCGSQF